MSGLTEFPTEFVCKNLSRFAYLRMTQAAAAAAASECPVSQWLAVLLLLVYCDIPLYSIVAEIDSR